MRFSFTIVNGVAGVCILLLLAACGKPSPGDASVVLDSAGVKVVESARPAWATGGAWTVDAEPLRSIGAAEGDTTQQLDRVSDARQVGADTILVVDGGSSQLRFYDGAGRLVHAVGRTGEGPGEFSRYGPGRLCVRGDGHILVADPIQRRAHAFTRGGTFDETISLRVEAAFPSVQGCFADGSLLGWHSEQAPERIPGRVNRATFLWTRISGDGANQVELARLPGPQQYLLDQGDGSATYHTIPFTVASSAAAAPGALYVTTGSAPEIERRTLEGVVDRVIRWTPTAPIRTADVYARYRTHVLDAQTRADRRRQWVRFFDVAVDVPERVPTVQSLLVDEDGSVWAERYRLPWDSAAVWNVFDGEGRWLGGVEVPDRLDVRQVGHDFVLGIHRDALGVERVRVHHLDRR